MVKRKAKMGASKSDRARQTDKNTQTNEKSYAARDGQATVPSPFVYGQQPLPDYPHSEASRKFLAEQKNKREELRKE